MVSKYASIPSANTAGMLPSISWILTCQLLILARPDKRSGMLHRTKKRYVPNDFSVCPDSTNHASPRRTRTFRFRRRRWFIAMSSIQMPPQSPPAWKQICDAMDYFLSAVDEDRIDLEKQRESRMAQPDPFFNLPRKREVPVQWHRPDLIST